MRRGRWRLWRRVEGGVCINDGKMKIMIMMINDTPTLKKRDKSEKQYVGMLQMLLQHYLDRAFFASTAQRVSNPKGQAAQLLSNFARLCFCF